MTDADRYEAKVLMHRIRYERGDGNDSRACTECGARTTRDSGPCTACLCKRLATYLGAKAVYDWFKAVGQLERADNNINDMLER